MSISAWLPAFVERSFFGPDISYVDCDSSIIVVVLGSVYCQHYAYDHDEVRIIIEADIVLIALPDYDTVLYKSCDLAVILKNGILESFMPVKAIAILVTLAIENTSPSLLAPKMIDPAVREHKVISFSEK